MGPEDGWWATAITMEDFHLRNIDCTGGAVDIMKCCDQLSRPVIFALAAAAGMPTNVLTTYFNDLACLTTYNAICGGLGKRVP